MTNLEKLKAEIAEMGAEKFGYEFAAYVFEKSNGVYCEARYFQNDCAKWCIDCRVNWLNSESEEKNGTND